MQRPPTYAKSGSKIIKKPGGTLYLVADVKPMLDQWEDRSRELDEDKKLYAAYRQELEELREQAATNEATNQGLRNRIKVLEKMRDRIDSLEETLKSIGRLVRSI